MKLQFDHTPTPQEAIDLLREHEPPQGYFGCFSGGKDSVVIKHLAKLAGVKCEWHYHKTTIDPPELVRFIKDKHPDVIFDSLKHGNFFNRMVAKGFPTRLSRWCCDEYKEGKFPTDSIIIMGIRAEESASRSKHWGLVSMHFKTGNKVINPIYEWSADELWSFIHAEKISYCLLYDEGFKRLGCVGCPLATVQNRLKEFKRWPQYERKWKLAFRNRWEYVHTHTKKNGGRYEGCDHWNNWEEMWNWWLHGLPLPNKKQLSLSVDNLKDEERFGK